MPKMTSKELQELIDEIVPNNPITVQDVKEKFAEIKLTVDEKNIRPGNTLSGPTLFLAADSAMYMALLGEIGPVAQAVTTNLSIDFLKKPKVADIIAQAELVKVGTRLAVGVIKIFSEGETDPVAIANCTYSIPPLRSE